MEGIACARTTIKSQEIFLTVFRNRIISSITTFAAGARQALNISILLTTADSAMDKTDFKTWFQASPNAYVVLTPDFRIAWANSVYLALTGRQLEDILHCKLLEAFAADDEFQLDGKQQVQDSLERTLHTKVRDELPHLHYPITKTLPSGEVVYEDRYWSATHTPVLDEKNNVRFILQHAEDISELYKAKRDLELAERELESGGVSVNSRILRRAETVQALNRGLLADVSQLRQLFAQAPGFMCFLRGPQHMIEMANDAYLLLIGKRDVLGKNVREALADMDDEGTYVLLDQVYSSGAAYVGKGVRIAFRQADGLASREHFLDFVYQPIKTANDEVIGIFVQGNDVTEQVVARNQLQLYRESEEERRRVQEALHQSQKMEAVDNLIGGVAHDFNNVLQIISGNLQLLGATTDTDALARRRLNAAFSGVERGAKLAAQLLAFARRQPLEPRVVNIARLLHDMDEMLRRTLSEAIELETIVDDGLWNASVDISQLENVLLNLAINARDAMDAHGKLTIEVSNALLDDAYAAANQEVMIGQYVMLAVSDTGEGMTPDIVERVFDPFFSTKPEGQGTGLGLSMVYGFVRQSGGHIKIYSEPNQGTCIKIYLPRAEGAEDIIDPVLTEPASGGTETILVVEDNAEVRETVIDLLTGLGYRVLHAADAQSALAVILSGVAIDLLFTDIVMPGTLRSPELARQAKLAQPALEVLFTSGYTENAIIHGGRLDPGVALLSKPYRKEELARKIRHIFRNKDHVETLRELNLQTVAAKKSDKRLRVLLVEDNPDALEGMIEMTDFLGHKPYGCASAEDALQVLKEQVFDLMITDIGLPGISGLDLAKKARMIQTLEITVASGYARGQDVPLNVGWLMKPFGIDEYAALLESAAKR